jgi:hypothetical protein
MFLAVSAFGLCEGGPITSLQSEAMYKAINVVLTVKYRDNPKLVKCMVDDFRGNKVADQIYSIDRILNPETSLANDIAKFEENAKLKCDIALFLQTPIGILILISILLIFILLCCCLLKCMCC